MKLNQALRNGWSDSPGYSTKYGTYSLMSTDLNKIVDFFVHVSTAGIQVEWERKVCKLWVKNFQIYEK